MDSIIRHIENTFLNMVKLRITRFTLVGAINATLGFWLQLWVQCLYSGALAIMPGALLSYFLQNGFVFLLVENPIKLLALN